MTIDLKWLLPFVMPFVLVALIRAVCWCAGVPEEKLNATGIAATALFIGGFCGSIAVGLVHADRIKWNVTIGKEKE